LWYEDLGTVPILFAKSKIVTKVKKPFYKYYQREGSIAHSENMKIFEIYDCLVRIKDYIELNYDSVEASQYLKVLNKMIVLEGGYLTTLRIKDFSDEVKLKYLSINLERINELYPNWIKDESLKEYPFKQKVVLKLFKLGKFKLLLRLFR
jgi:hypothetical protein